MYNFFGGPPATVIVKLLATCFVVGVIFSFLGVSPFEIIDGLTLLLKRIYNLGYDAFDWIVRYFLLGAVIVVPVWLISRIWNAINRPRGKKSTGSPFPPKSK